eukprot:RCo018086
MDMVSTLSEALGRELLTCEVNLLQALSPQGVAKINSDIAKGVSLELTLAELKVVFRAVKHRQALAKSLVPKVLLPVVERMGRSPTLDELVLLAGAPAPSLLSKIDSRTKKGEALEHVLEELSMEYRLELMHSDAQRLTEERGRRACTSYLSPTGLHPTHSIGLTMSIVGDGGEPRKRLRVGPSPHVSWFSEPVQGVMTGCTPARLSSPSSPSARSALKKGPSPGVRSSSSLQLSSSTSTLGPDPEVCTPCAQPEPGADDIFLVVPSDTPAALSRRVSFAPTGGCVEGSPPRICRNSDPFETCAPSKSNSDGAPRAILHKLKVLLLTCYGAHAECHLPSKARV